MTVDSSHVSADVPINYMGRTREWYLALGYDNPYEWAHYDSVPLSLPRKPMNRCNVAIVTTAAPYQPGNGPQGPGAPYNAAAKFYNVYTGSTATNPDLRVSHVGIDRKHTSMVDHRCWFPLEALRRASSSGRIGGISRRFYGMPTNRSQKQTITDAQELVRLCHEDDVDVALLVPNCPVCHQTMSISARHLEQAGISTAIMGCAKDIVEYVGVPRFLFSDFPLGNSAGKPSNVKSQSLAVELSLSLIERAIVPRTTYQNPLKWSANSEWKADYCNIQQYTAEELQKLREDNDRMKEVARRQRQRDGL